MTEENFEIWEILENVYILYLILRPLMRRLRSLTLGRVLSVWSLWVNRIWLLREEDFEKGSKHCPILGCLRKSKE